MRKKSKQKRVEYQKFVRTKLEQRRYRGLFGLTDNIVLEGEEDLILQREFRFDFVLQKIDSTIPMSGIFSHFKLFNHLEFKSYNDPLMTIHLTKYIGQTFWWLYAKRLEAKEDKSSDIRGDEVTLNIMSVRRPRNVINELDELLDEDFIRHGGGHYQCDVMGVELHIFVINEFPIEREYYAWLIFSEGKQYEKFKEKLAQEIENDEKYQIYLELITELEKEGSEKMAYDILRRILSEMPVEQKQGIYYDFLERTLKNGEEKMAYDILRRILSEMPVEQQQKAVSPDIIKGILSRMPAEQKQEVISSDTLERILTEGTEKMGYEILRKILSDMSFEQKREIVSSVLSDMQTEQTQAVLSPDVLRRILSDMSVKKETISEVLDQISKNSGRREISNLS